MSLGQNIRLRRESLGMTQDDLAKILGYKNRSTIAKIENSTNDLTQSKIAAIAKALQTTPSSLIDWEIPPSKPEGHFEVSAEEIALVEKFRCLDERGKAAVLNTLDHEYNSLPGEKANTLAKEA